MTTRTSHLFRFLALAAFVALPTTAGNHPRIHSANGINQSGTGAWPLWDNVYTVEVPPYPFNVDLGIGHLINPDDKPVYAQFTLHHTTGYGGPFLDPTLDQVTYTFDGPTTVTAVEVITHTYGLHSMEGFVGDADSAETSIGIATIPGFGLYPELSTIKFTFPNPRPGKVFRFVVKSGTAGAYAAYRAYPHDEKGQRIPPTQFGTPTSPPNRGGNVGYLTTPIKGDGFPAGSVTVALRTAGQPDIVARVAKVVDSTTLIVTFDLTGAPPGIRDVILTFSEGTSKTLSDAFQIVNGGGAKLDLHINAPGSVRAGRNTDFLGLVRNVGINNADFGIIDFSLLALTASQILFPQTLAQVTSINIASFAPGESIRPVVTANVLDCANAILRTHIIKDLRALPCDTLGTLIRQTLNAIDLKEAELAQIERDMADHKNGTTGQPDPCKCAPPQDPTCSILCVKRAKLLLDLNGPQDGSRPEKGLKGQLKLLCEACQTHNPPCDCAGCSSPSSNMQRASIGENVSPDLSLQSELPEVVTTYPFCPIYSWDPNDKVGPVGSGQSRSMRGGEPIPYTIFFENKAAASAPAQQVLITDQLNASLDWASLSLGSISFGETAVEVSEGLQDYSTTIDLRPAKNLLVQMVAGLHLPTGVLRWQFATLDPDTGEPPLDPFAGFLPPNKTPPEGEGSVSFVITPKEKLSTGTEIRNKATIVFDMNPPIETPEWMNTIDNDKPSSQVEPLPPSQKFSSFLIKWSGSDVGSGIQDYSIYVSDNGGSFTPLLENTMATSANFAGERGHSYAFYSVARDNVNNYQDIPSIPDTTTLIAQDACKLECPADIVTATDAGACSAVVHYEVRVTGNCPGLTLDCEPPSGSVFQKGSTLVTCKATDVGGNSAACTFAVVVEDGEKPAITKCAPDTVVIPDSTGHGVVPDLTSAVTALDNCGTLTLSQRPAVGSVVGLGVTDVTITATDSAGNESECFAKCTVADRVSGDVTAYVKQTRSGFRLNRATKRYTQAVTLQNVSAVKLSGPISLLLDNLSKNALLANRTGTTTATLPAGSPYLDANLGTAVDLVPGQSVTLTLEFTNPSNQGITYTTRALAGPGAR